MKNRGLKTTTAISNSVNSDLWLKLKEYSSKTSIPISKLLDKAIVMFLNSLKV